MDLYHGGPPVNLLVDDKRRSILKDIMKSLPSVTLGNRQLCDLELLATGAFSPLGGFMVRSDYESVLDRMRLQSGKLWPIPICLDITEQTAHSLEAGQSVVLRDPEGVGLAVMHIEEIWPVDRKKEAEAVYGTNNKFHQGVRYLYDQVNDYYMGGKLEVMELPVHFDFRQNRLSPKEMRAAVAKLGWKRIVCFVTRNPIHRPQFEMTLTAMRSAGASLLILAVAGMTSSMDFDHFTRVRCYKAAGKQYPPDAHMLNLLPHAMRMAGPREAVLHAVFAKNYGCTHLIIGHNHASPDRIGDSPEFYKGDDANKMARTFSSEIGLTIIPFKEIVYLPFEDEFRSIDKVSEATQSISLTGRDIRERFRTGKRIPDWATFSNVMDELYKAYPPPRKQGFTVFLTGLSGAGKSTIAKILYSKFLEIGDRPVTLLDGDIVRRNLSSELTFSKEHRDLNVKRIGFVAGEITKNRGIAICAPIAPYHRTRSEIREAIETYGGFFEVHVATPLSVCEDRDRKGMYAKARAGLIKGFTGVDDPYEDPLHPELKIDTTSLTPDEAAKDILLCLNQRGYI